MVRGPLNPKHGTAGTTPGTVVTKAPGRSYLFFQNLSDTDMYLAVGDGEEAAAGVGMLIPKSGGYFEWFHFVPTDRVRVYCGSDGKAYSCYEG